MVNFCCNTKLRLRVSDRQGKHAVSIFKVYSAISGKHTSSPDCKYKHMLENRAPSDKFGVLYTADMSLGTEITSELLR